jgi:hypothetical protein
MSLSLGLINLSFDDQSRALLARVRNRKKSSSGK